MSNGIQPTPVSQESWGALYRVAKELAALAPWKFAADCDLAGISDAAGQERIGNVLGNAGEVFAAVFYREQGVPWVLSMMVDEPDPEALNNAEGMNCLKLEFVTKRELDKEDLAIIKDVGFKPVGRGPVWPQFRSLVPGWHPWFIDSGEAEQLLGDLQHLIAFMKLFEQHPDLYDGAGVTEIPFLPNELPDRPLTVADLEWNPIVNPPVGELPPYKADGDTVEQLNSLVSASEVSCEFDCALLPGASFMENGRPCFGRLMLMVDASTGAVMGMDIKGAAVNKTRATGEGFVKCLQMFGARPGVVRLLGGVLIPVLKPLCAQLDIELQTAPQLPWFDTAFEDLSSHLASGE